jgi:hypothetical protein
MMERTVPQRAGPNKAIHCNTSNLVNTTKLHHPTLGEWKTTNQQTVASSFQRGTNSQVHSYMVWKPNLRSSRVTPCFSFGTLHLHVCPQSQVTPNKFTKYPTWVSPQYHTSMMRTANDPGLIVADSLYVKVGRPLIRTLAAAMKILCEPAG